MNASYPTWEELMQTDNRLTVTLVAAYFGKSVKTIYQWAKRPEFPRRGEDGRFSDLEIQAYAAKYAVPTVRRG